MSQNSQLHLTNDSFIYACQSEFAARTKKDGSFNSHLRYEDFLTGSFKRPENPTMKDFSQVVLAIARHQSQVTPQFRRREPINLETVSYFTCSIATLFADLESACREFFGTGLPVIPENPPEYSTEAPFAHALLNARTVYLGQLATNSVDTDFSAFPRSEFPTVAAELQLQTWSCEMWDLIADALFSVFGDYADAAMGFAYWKYQESPERPPIDWRVRPPVGEAYAKAFKPLLRSSRGDRGDRGGRGDRGDRGDRGGRGDRGDRGDRGGRGERGDRPERGERSAHADRPAHAERSERPVHAERSERPVHAERAERPAHAERGERPVHGERPKRTEQGDREPGQRNFNETPAETSDRHERKTRDGKPRDSRHDNPRRGGSDRHRDERPHRGQGGHPGAGQSSEQQLFEALEEVRTAAAALKENPGQGEIQLKPNNSFIRRQQHSLAVEMGFDTESRGEGKDRGVVLRMAQA